MKIRRLGKDDAAAMEELNALFAEVFEMPDEYVGRWLDRSALAVRLNDPNIWVLTAEEADRVIGGLTAYMLPKMEAPVSELFVYDLAVASDRQRQGVGTAILEEACKLAGAAGARLAIIEAEPDDAAPLSLYRKLATSEEIAHHFNLPTRCDG
ncbi:MAG: GNAT family N-acetyltransferase [Sphingomonas sp.]|nr:GNAT family N-acetyltransferase [Sphingomonas sp.]